MANKLLLGTFYESKCKTILSMLCLSALWTVYRGVKLCSVLSSVFFLYRCVRTGVHTLTLIDVYMLVEYLCLFSSGKLV